MWNTITNLDCKTSTPRIYLAAIFFPPLILYSERAPVLKEEATYIASMGHWEVLCRGSVEIVLLRKVNFCKSLIRATQILNSENVRDTRWQCGVTPLVFHSTAHPAQYGPIFSTWRPRLCHNFGSPRLPPLSLLKKKPFGQTSTF